MPLLWKGSIDMNDVLFLVVELAAMAAIPWTVWTWREGAAPVAPSAALLASAGS
jgi:hypothetical protein